MSHHTIQIFGQIPNKLEKLLVCFEEVGIVEGCIVVWWARDHQADCAIRDFLHSAAVAEDNSMEWFQSRTMSRRSVPLYRLMTCLRKAAVVFTARRLDR